MPRKYRVFLDSSALFSAIFSSKGGGRLILRLAEGGVLEVLLSRQVLTETERSLRKKAPELLGYYTLLLDRVKALIVADPPPPEVERCATLVPHPADALVLAAATSAQADYFVTLDRRHFLDVPGLAEQAGLPMGTPGDFIAWYRNRLLEEGG